MIPTTAYTTYFIHNTDQYVKARTALLSILVSLRTDLVDYDVAVALVAECYVAL